MKITIIRTRIIGTDDVYYSAWEPYAGHSSYRTEGGRKLGKVTSRPVPTILDDLPRGDYRYRVVTDWLDGLKREATDAITTAYPWLTEVGRATEGEVHVRVGDEVGHAFTKETEVG